MLFHNFEDIPVSVPNVGIVISEPVAVLKVSEGIQATGEKKNILEVWNAYTWLCHKVGSYTSHNLQKQCVFWHMNCCFWHYFTQKSQRNCNKMQKILEWNKKLPKYLVNQFLRSSKGNTLYQYAVSANTENTLLILVSEMKILRWYIPEQLF